MGANRVNKTAANRFFGSSRRDTNDVTAIPLLTPNRHVAHTVSIIVGFTIAFSSKSKVDLIFWVITRSPTYFNCDYFSRTFHYHRQRK